MIRGQRLFQAFFGALLIAGALAACGSSSTSGGTTVSPSPAPTAAKTPRALPDDLCNAIDGATIDSVLKVNVGSGIWDGTHNCVWVSKQPAGGLTLSRLTEAQGAPFLTGGTPVPGLGVRAVAGRTQTAQPSPLPASAALVVVDLGDKVLSIHVSGPAVTLQDAVTIAHDLLG